MGTGVLGADENVTIDMEAQQPQTSEEHPVVVRLTRETSLSRGAARGSVWLTFGTGAQQAFQFGISIVMARLLTPGEFGQAAIVFSVAAFAQIFTDLGLTASVVQTSRLTEEVLASAFWLNALTGLALTALFSALAIPLADIYGHPDIRGLMILASLNFTLSCGSVHLALLERSFRFRRIATLEFVASIVGLISGPVAFLLGCGVYSLMVSMLTSTTLLSIFYIGSVRWWPRRFATRAALRRIWRFARGLVGFNAVNYWGRNVDNLALGITVSAADLGRYNRAYSLTGIPVSQTSGVFMRALYPALARMQDDRPRLARAWTRTMSAVTGGFAVPVTLTMAATAPALVSVLYGSRWTPMTPMLEILCLAAVPQILLTGTGGPLRAMGETGVLFKISLITASTSVLAIFAGLPFGAVGVCVAILVNSWLMVPVCVRPLARGFGTGWPELVRGVVTTWHLPIIAALCELAVRLLMPGRANDFVVLATQLAVGGLVFAGLVARSSSEVGVWVRARVSAWYCSRRAPALAPTEREIL